MVVGGGISGLATAYHVSRAHPEAAVTVLESEREVGGTSRSDTVDGYTIDRGANGFLTNVPHTLELARELGLEAELQPAADAAKLRFLYYRDALRALPSSPGQFLSTRLLSLTAKLRVALEPFAPARDPAVDETVFDFASRRLGKAFAEVFIAPMVLGITAGDARSTSLAALFPRMRQLEDRHGSLIRGMLAGRREARRRAEEDRIRGGPAGPGGRLTSFREGGAGRLIQALRRQLGERVKTGAKVVTLKAVTPTDGSAHRYALELASGESLEGEVVVLAIPAYVSADLLEQLLPEVRTDLQAIPYAGVRVLGLGYPRSAVSHPLDGFGFLVPRGQGVRILGCLWTSSLFPNQAPTGRVLLRIIAGGVPDPEFVTLGNEEALQVVREDLRRTMGITAEPQMVRHIRWPRAIPQYTVGHQQRVERIMNALEKRPGLLLTGNSYHGIGLNDCTREARRVAEQVGALLEVPPVSTV